MRRVRGGTGAGRPRPALTYPEAGATADVAPPGYHRSGYARVVGQGRADFERGSAALYRWEVHRRAGLRIGRDTAAVAPGVDVRMRLGVGPLALSIPCRVVYVVDEPDRRGFAYGTLPGHPEIGEESFRFDLDDDGRVTFTMTAFSRPGRWYSRAAGPLGRLVQRLALRRYAWAATTECARE